jgi:transmembrane sensor
MSKYELFDVDDFVSDPYFIDWVLNPQPAHHAFWDDWKIKYPHQLTKLDSARQIVLSLTIRPLKKELSAKETEKILAHVKKNISTNSASLSSIWHNIKIWSAAAVLLAALTCFWLYQRQNNSLINSPDITVNGLNEYDNTTKTSKIVRFADGSIAVLKPKSKLRYPTTFTGATRTVYLEGEAFFEVQKDATKPFLIFSHDMVTQVLGTSFTVKAYDGAEEFKVIVNTGKVKVYHKGQLEKENTQAVTIIPHQQATYKRNSTAIKKDTVETPLLLTEEAATQSFTLNKITLSEVIIKLEEAYGVQINYDKSLLGNQLLTAQLANLPLDQKVELICKAINATCKFSNGEIYIYHQSTTNQ